MMNRERLILNIRSLVSDPQAPFERCPQINRASPGETLITTTNLLFNTPSDVSLRSLKFRPLKIASAKSTNNLPSRFVQRQLRGNYFQKH